MNHEELAIAEIAIRRIKTTNKFTRLNFPFEIYGKATIRNHIEKHCGRGFIGSWSPPTCPSEMSWYGTRWTFISIIITFLCCKSNHPFDDGVDKFA